MNLPVVTANSCKTHSQSFFQNDLITQISGVGKQILVL
jgi:hypothetical protein